MGFLKSFFLGKEESPEEKKKRDDERDFDVLKTDGARALRMGQGEAAVRCLTKALEIKDDLEVRDYLSQAFIRCDRLVEAREQLQVLAQAQPDNVQILIMMARVDYMREDYNAMADICEKAMLLDADNAEVLFLYARAAKGQHDLVNAVAMLTKSIMLNEHFGDAYLERGKILLQMGDVEGAAEDAAYLMEVASEVEDVLLLQAAVMEASGRLPEAIATYDKAIKVNPFSIAAFKGRGAARLALGDKEGAEIDMRQLLELDPTALQHLSGEFKSQGRD